MTCRPSPAWISCEALRVAASLRQPLSLWWEWLEVLIKSQEGYRLVQCGLKEREREVIHKNGGSIIGHILSALHHQHRRTRLPNHIRVLTQSKYNLYDSCMKHISTYEKNNYNFSMIGTKYDNHVIKQTNKKYIYKMETYKISHVWAW